MKTRYSAVLIAAVISLLVMSAPVYAADSNIGIYVNGTWYLDLVGNGAWSASTDTMYSFGGGVTGAIPVTGDWTGSGTTKIGIYANGIWYLDLVGTGVWVGTPTDAMYNFGGQTGAIPVTGDWTGSGTTKIGIFVPGSGTWYLDLNGNGAWDGTPTDALYTFGHGIADAIPVTGDWTGSGTTKIGVYVPSSGRWYLDLNGNGAWDGTPTDALYTFGGMTGAVPVTGKWFTAAPSVTLADATASCTGCHGLTVNTTVLKSGGYTISGDTAAQWLTIVNSMVGIGASLAPGTTAQEYANFLAALP